MSGAKICRQQIWGSKNYQMTSYFGNGVILSLWRQTATTPTLVPTVMVHFIQATSIVQFQLEDFEFITKLKEQTSNFYFYFSFSHCFQCKVVQITKVLIFLNRNHFVVTEHAYIIIDKGLDFIFA